MNVRVTKQEAYKIIFEHDTPAGRRFDLILLWTILFSVLVVMVESIPDVHSTLYLWFYSIEWILTILFTIEYGLRIWSSPKPLKYIFSTWGLIDLLSILPSYLEFFLVGSHYLLIIRIMRLMRVFRILKLARFNKEAMGLLVAVRSSSYKIGVFLAAVLTLVTILGTLMYVIEGGKYGFSSIPQSIYWAIVTVTTVGFGDVVPHTVAGKILSSIAMILGYAIIAVPTGIITVGLSRSRDEVKTCRHCRNRNPETAIYCNACGKEIGD